MDNKSNFQNKSDAYGDVLKQATKFPPVLKFIDSDGVLKGLYRLDGDRVRMLPVKDVEKKRQELRGGTTSVREDE